MPFPDSKRVIYAKNPLAEVVCQLRFPPILRIGSEAPAAFQEKIRSKYPLFKENRASEIGLELPPEIVEQITRLPGNLIPSPLRVSRISYDFISDDEQWRIGLTRDFISLSTTKYERWEDFKAHLEQPLQLFIEIYSPAFFQRVGLRYRDLICRSRLGMTNAPWSDLLESPISGELAASEIAGCIEGAWRQVKLRLPDNEGEVLIQHGLVNTPENEVCYLIDSDFSFSGRTEVKDAVKKLDSFNQKSGRLFRWCITDRLHRAMEPQPIF